MASRPLTTTDGQRHAFDHFVVAAGAWSHRLSARTGRAVPAGERARLSHGPCRMPGFRDRPPDQLRRAQVHVHDDGARPAPGRHGGVRRAGGRPANWGRADKLVRARAGRLPDCGCIGDAEPWMGQRPATPDSHAGDRAVEEARATSPMHSVTAIWASPAERSPGSTSPASSPAESQPLTSRHSVLIGSAGNTCLQSSWRAEGVATQGPQAVSPRLLRPLCGLAMTATK